MDKDEIIKAISKLHKRFRAIEIFTKKEDDVNGASDREKLRKAFDELTKLEATMQLIEKEDIIQKIPEIKTAFYRARDSMISIRNTSDHPGTYRFTLEFFENLLVEIIKYA